MPKNVKTDRTDQTQLLQPVFESLSKSVGATIGRALSNDAIMVDGHIAAFISKGRLVVKLPENRLEELIASGEAARMRMGNREMKQWVAVTPAAGKRWIDIAEESARYVRAVPPKKRRR